MVFMILEIVHQPYDVSKHIDMHYHYPLQIQFLICISLLLLSLNHHSNEQILLLGVWEKLHVALSAGMADHGKAGDLVGRSVSGFDGYESPVHLVAFTGHGLVTPPAISLRRHDHSLWREKVQVVSDVIFY